MLFSISLLFINPDNIITTSVTITDQSHFNTPSVHCQAPQHVKSETESVNPHKGDSSAKIQTKVVGFEQKNPLEYKSMHLLS